MTDSKLEYQKYVELSGWDVLGEVVANATSVEQVEFFQAFIKEVRSWGPNAQRVQMVRIGNELSRNDRMILRQIAATTD